MENKQADPVRVAAAAEVKTADAANGAEAANSAKDWPSYNKTITSERFSALDQITKDNARGLSVLCTYDTGQYTGFNSGLLEIEGALVFSTEYDIFSIDPNTCRENWRVQNTPATPQGVSREPAFYDNMLFRGTQDGRVLAYK